MPSRKGGGGGGRSSPRSASPPSRNYSSSSPARAPPPPPPPTRVIIAQPVPTRKQPGLMGQMAATAGGVAVGSVAGQMIGQAMTGSGQKQSAEQQYEQYRDTEPTGPCAWQIKQFLRCASGQNDLNVCQQFNEALQQCKAQNNIP